MPWIIRGLRDGIVTTKYPNRADGYGPHYRGAVKVLTQPHADDLEATDRLGALCPTGAISTDAEGPAVDMGRCILCGRCVERRPDLFAFDSGFEHAAVARDGLLVPGVQEDDVSLQRLRRALDARARSFRRSLHIRHVDIGSDGSEEWEIAALTNPVYDVARLGIFFTASPRHADLLLVTGAGSVGMLQPALRTFDAMPDPKVVIAAGVEAISGGMVHPTYATRGGVASFLPVDVWIPGSPPSPFALLQGILLALGHLGKRRGGQP